MKKHLEPSAFRMFAHNASQKEIASTLGVSETTISAWKAQYNWDERKDIEINSTQFSVNHMKKMLAELNSSVESIKDDDKYADKVSKLTAAIERMDKHFDLLGSTLKVMDDFSAWASNHDDELFQAIQRNLRGFLAHMRKKYNR